MTADRDTAPDAAALTGAAVARVRRVLAALADPADGLVDALAAAEATGSWVPPLPMVDVDPFAGIRVPAGTGGSGDEPSASWTRRSPPAIRRRAGVTVDAAPATGVIGRDRAATAVPGIATTPSLRWGVAGDRGDRDPTGATLPSLGDRADPSPSAAPSPSPRSRPSSAGTAAAPLAPAGDSPDAITATDGPDASAASPVQPFGELATDRLDAILARPGEGSDRESGPRRRPGAPDQAISDPPGVRPAPGPGVRRSELDGRPVPASFAGPPDPGRDPTTDLAAPWGRAAPAAGGSAGGTAGAPAEGPAARGPGFVLRRGGRHAVHAATAPTGERPVAVGDRGDGRTGSIEVAAEDLVALVAEVLAAQARRHGVDLS